MNGRLAAARFLVSAMRPAGGVSAPTAVTMLGLPSGRIDADLYQHPDPSAATVILVNGMAMRGYRDPRVGALARRLADTGLRVVVPCLPEIEALTVDPAVIERIADTVVEVSARAGRPVGVFAISFAGGLSLVAATRARATGAVSALCAVGSFDDATEALRFALVDAGADPYARMVLLRQFLPRLAPHLGAAPLSAAAIRTLDAMLEDSGFERTDLRHPAHLAGLSTAERQFIAGMAHDPAARATLYAALLEVDAAGVAAMSAVAAAPHVLFPVLLVHGAGDTIIPPDASVRLAAALTAAGVSVRLRITRLLGHGDVAVGPALVSEAAGLWADFAWWFAHVGR